MKKECLFLAVLLMALLSFAVSGQTAATEKPKVQEPEYIGVFMGLNESGDLIELERLKTQVKFRLKGLGFGGAEASLQVPGEKSSIRLPC